MFQRSVSNKVDLYGSECQTPSPEEYKETQGGRAQASFHNELQAMHEWAG